jgi:hypothetical protein
MYYLFTSLFLFLPTSYPTSSLARCQCDNLKNEVLLFLYLDFAVRGQIVGKRCGHVLAVLLRAWTRKYVNLTVLLRLNCWRRWNIGKERIVNCPSLPPWKTSTKISCERGLVDFVYCLSSVCLSYCLSVLLYVCLTVWLSYCLSVLLSVCLTVVCLTAVCLSYCLSVFLSVCLTVCLAVLLLSVCLSCFLSVLLSVCLAVCLSYCCLSVCLSCFLSVLLSVCLSYVLSYLLSVFFSFFLFSRWWFCYHTFLQEVAMDSDEVAVNILYYQVIVLLILILIFTEHL